MDKNIKNEIALLKYSVIVPLINDTYDEGGSKQDFFRAAASHEYPWIDGTKRSFSPATIERWYYSYKKNGFAALYPVDRSDQGESRKLDDELKQVIANYVTSFPRMSATAIHSRLIAEGFICKSDVSDTTVRRYVKTIRSATSVTVVRDMRRYERSHINEVWCGDSSVSIYIRENGVKRRVYVIALIDDASRMIVGINAFFSDNYENLLSVMKSAVSRHGVPKVWNFDNGSNYKNHQIELLSARIGSCINYCKPYTPTAKAKIERWFRTMKDQWSAEVTPSDFKSLEDVRSSLFKYVNLYNNSVHSSLDGTSPHDRFFSEPECIRWLNPDDIDTLFLLEDTRRVTADSVIKLNNAEYETDSRFSGSKVTVRYSPDMSCVFVEDTDGTLIPVRLLNKKENAVAKRQEHIFGGADNG
ncbi:MAG: DDE-type integrase/transposase/recombinase [Oscillospiraceae bacterium]|nr:DDE-type integrase/transposase/recombinase [Oscillospiraceae bacterium]